MKQYKGTIPVLNFAINNETKAIKFFKKLAKQQENNKIKELLMRLVREEQQHKVKLIHLKKAPYFIFEPQAAGILNKQTKKQKLSPNRDIDDILNTALQLEKDSINLYSQLSSYTKDEAVKNLLLMLSQQEEKHYRALKIQFRKELS